MSHAERDTSMSYSTSDWLSLTRDWVIRMYVTEPGTLDPVQVTTSSLALTGSVRCCEWSPVDWSRVSNPNQEMQVPCGGDRGLEERRARVMRFKGIYRDREPGVSWADELLRDRREEAAREDA
ncbi:MAG: hypothetical protein HY321_14950 [Armatimonadetes bacterium]|nr:hypothetical protein [Armatimonadota bacterium]